MSNGMRNGRATHIDFGFLQGSIKVKPAIMPSNLDMTLCKDGEVFLIGEWKRENENILLGQKILLKGLSRQPNFTVLLIIGHSDETSTKVNDFYVIRGDYMRRVGNGIDALKTYINNWWDNY